MPWKRRPFSGSNLARALNIADLRAVARRRVPHFVFEYVEGGAEEEATLRCNRAAFESLKLIPQTLVDTSARNLRTEILGRPAPAPCMRCCGRPVTTTPHFASRPRLVTAAVAGSGRRVRAKS